MKLLYILNVAGRVNNFSYSSMCAAKELGFEFHIAGNWGYKSSQERCADEEKYGIKIHQIDFERSPVSPKNKKAYNQLLELMKRENYDAVHCNTPIGGLLGRLCAKKCKVNKVIYQVHGFHFYKGAPALNWLVYYPVEKWLSKYTDALVTINKEDFERASEKRFSKTGIAYYVPGVGIDLEQFAYRDGARGEMRAEMGIGENDTVLISVGELNKNKNTSVIVSALEKLNDSSVHYIVCGVGDERENLENQVKAAGLENNVHFLGYRNDILKLYSASDVFVMSSFREGLSRSIMEAMAMGLPCVVSEIRGNVDMIDDGKGGFLCPVTDAQAYAKAIGTLCSSAQLRESMKAYNLEKIRQFELCRATEEIRKVYSEVFLG